MSYKGYYVKVCPLTNWTFSSGWDNGMTFFSCLKLTLANRLLALAFFARNAIVENLSLVEIRESEELNFLRV